MARKLLTAITELEAVELSKHLMVHYQMTRQQTANALAEAEGKYVIQYGALKTLNVQRLMTYMRLIEMVKLLPMLEPRKVLRGTSLLMMPSEEEELATRKRLLPYRQMQEIETERAQRLRPEEIRQKVREIALSRTSINLIDQTAFAELEEYLWKNFPLQTYQVLGELLKLSLRKSWYLDKIAGLEPLEKLMLQMYIYAFMEFPLQMNLLGMKVTPLSMTVLRERVASIYMTYNIQNEKLAQKWQLISALVRKTETKGLVRGKTKQEQVPLKENIGVTTSLTEDTEVSTGRDLMGKEWFFIAMRYAYSMPFWLRRRLVRNMGMPENHKYARYFGIGCIPSRYARYSWKYRRYSEESFTYFRRDEYLKMQKKFDKLHRIGVPNKGRYGSGKIWTRY